MVKNPDQSFDEQFMTQAKQVPVLKKTDTLESGQTYVNVGNKGNFPFDMDENIFDLDRPCPKAARYKGIKMKDINIPVSTCGVCNKNLQIPKAVQ